MGYLMESQYFRKRDWKEPFQNCYSDTPESGRSFIAVKVVLIAEAILKWVIRVELCARKLMNFLNRHASMGKNEAFLQAVDLVGGSLPLQLRLQLSVAWATGDNKGNSESCQSPGWVGRNFTESEIHIIQLVTNLWSYEASLHADTSVYPVVWYSK